MAASNTSIILHRLRATENGERFHALQEAEGTTGDVVIKAEAVRIANTDKVGYNRHQALKVLRHYWPDGEVIRAFTARLGDELYIAALVIEILGEIADDTALKLLEKAYFGASNSWIKLQILGHLDRAPQAFIHDFILKSSALNHRDEKIRAATVALLGKLRNRTLKRVFLGRLKDPDPRVRANALEGLAGVCSGRELARILVRFVRDPNNRVRANALLLLLKLGVRQAEEQLIQMAQHGDALFRASAAYVMSQLPPSPSLGPWVRRLAEDPDEAVSAHASSALQALAPA